MGFYRNKEAEAKEELKRRAKQLEMQRREQQRMNQVTRGYGGSGGGGSMAGGYNPVQRYEAPSVSEYRTPSPATAREPAKPAFKGTGMKLGKKKGNDLTSVLGGEVEEAEPVYEPEPEPEPVVEVSADVLEKVEQKR